MADTYCCVPMNYDVVHILAQWMTCQKDRYNRGSRISWSTVSKAEDRYRTGRRAKSPMAIDKIMSDRTLGYAGSVKVEWKAQ